MSFDMSQLKDQGIVAAIAMYLLRELWNMIIGSAKRRLKALEDNTKAIVSLETRMKDVQQAIQDIPKLKQDVTMAHVKIREMEEKFDQ